MAGSSPAMTVGERIVRYVNLSAVRYNVVARDWNGHTMLAPYFQTYSHIVTAMTTT
jgi:hypothetical protein